ncbi:uncharacterized protein LOC143292154 [Babylonia areolata]|uniref:uncharacterized protein LOC143292154 n=1 Tax=Babylonia areolata TaxID=304850 RepID=UPI003FD098D9
MSTTESTTSTTTSTTSTTPTALCPGQKPKGGRKVAGGEDACDHPGVVGVVEDSTGIITCTGVLLTPSTLLLAKGCSDFYAAQIGATYTSQGGGTATITFTVYAENGVQKVKLSNATDFKYSPNEDGTVSVELPSPISSSGACNTVACVYDDRTMSGRVAFDKCHLAGYGVTSSTEMIYTGVLKSVPITRKVTDPCCSAMIREDTQFDTEASVTVTTQPLLQTVCLASQSAATCMGDQGGPIYCPADTGELVMVALAGGQFCQKDALFSAIDHTEGVFANAI